MAVRFAPSPTGSLHLGNLRTAWISHQFARELGLPWLVRFEDIDQPRVLPGAQANQLADLRSLGLTPDLVTVQSHRHVRHESLFRSAVRDGIAYPCTCSRRDIQSELERMASAPHVLPAVYHGHCRRAENREKAAHPTIGWRFLNPDDPGGRHDFIVARTRPDGSEFCPAYHWACAIDDHDSGSQLLVRASDLASAVRYQRRVHDWLTTTTSGGHPPAAVFHTSLITLDDGSRLEKRTSGITLEALSERGIGPDHLTRIYATSFDSDCIGKFSSGRIWGEAREQRTLSDLGIVSNDVPTH